MEYLITLVILLIVAGFLEFKYHLHLYNSRKERVIIPIIFLIIGTIWDSFAVYRQHWTFSDARLIGIKIGILPIEEYLFMIIVPYFILTVYKILMKKMEKKKGRLRGVNS